MVLAQKPVVLDDRLATGGRPMKDVDIAERASFYLKNGYH